MKVRSALLGLALIALAVLGAWYFLSSGLLPISQSLRQASIIQRVLPTAPTPTLAPQSDLDQELQQADDVLSTTNPDDFSIDVFTETNLGL